jgi:uncharacterized membrane protein (UPF0136 family)
MTWLRGVLILYALLDIASGVQGYMAGGKLPWLIWNVGFGVVVIGGVALAHNRPKIGYAICACMAALDTVFFGRKLLMTQAVWPAGVITVAAVTALACAVIGMISSRRAANPPMDGAGRHT